MIREKMIKNLENIPVKMRMLNNCCGIKLNIDGTVNKKPYSIIDGKPGIRAYESNRLASFEVAKEALIKGEIVALCFAVKKSDGLIVLDSDCHHEWQIEKFKQVKTDYLNRLLGYAENSIGADGMHIFLEAELLEEYKHKCKFGITDLIVDNKCVIVTCDIIEGRSNEIMKCQSETEALMKEYFKVKEEQVGSIGTKLYEVSDTDLIEKVNTTHKGKRFLDGHWDKIMKTVDGKKVQYYPSQSEADLGFVMQILYYGGNNPQQAERIFRNSKMFRSKGKSTGYVKHCVNTATMLLTRVHDWKKVNVDKLEEKKDVEDMFIESSASSLVDRVQKYGFDGFNDPVLNRYVGKYILNYGPKIKAVLNTRMGDYDSASNGVRFYNINKNDLIYDDENKEWL